jgi:ketosteroid isomerase-like protein
VIERHGHEERPDELMGSVLSRSKPQDQDGAGRASFCPIPSAAALAQNTLRSSSMIFRLAGLVLALLLAGSAAGQGPPAGSPLRSLVDTERAFSDMSVAQGTRAAFLTYFADDGVSFGPAPVNTKQSINSQPAPATPPAIILEWMPVTADVARTGDLGYTTGPWVRTERSAARKPLAWGWYFTVWQKQADGSWKAVADIGTATPAHLLPGIDAFRPASQMGRPAISAAPVQKADAAEVAAAEKSFSDLAAGGALNAYLACATGGARLHRNGVEPLVGTDAMTSFFAGQPVRMTSAVIKADISRSGDLGYAYGSYALRTELAGTTSEERGYYLRVWKRLGGGWRIVADIANVAPPEAPLH